MFQKHFIKLLKETASTTMKNISPFEVRPPFQGGKTKVWNFTDPWVAGSDETGALDPAGYLNPSMNLRSAGLQVPLSAA
jgi:hypothetical protein